MNSASTPLADPSTSAPTPALAVNHTSSDGACWRTVIKSTENSGPAILGVSESPANSVHDTAPVDVMLAPSTPVTTPAHSTGHSTASSFSRGLMAATEPETPFSVG